MKKYSVLFLVVMFYCNYNHSQNLVLNNEFEDTTFCPTGLDQLNAATGWRSYAGTADYFNTCSFSIFSKVPANYFGYQQPSSGKAYASFYAYYTGYPNYREFVGSTLATPLVAGTKYFISFKVALANKHDYNRSCNNLGIRFTNWDYWYGYPAPVNNWAHFHSTAIISDTMNWTRISGSFVADSSYTRVMIGNFFNDSNTTSVGDATQYGAYYYLDDVCVSTDSAYCKNYMGVQDAMNFSLLSVFPNPFADQTTFTFDSALSNAWLKVYDVLGKEVTSLSFSGRQITLRRRDLKNGIYFYQVASRNKVVASGKLMVE